MVTLLNSLTLDDIAQSLLLNQRRKLSSSMTETFDDTNEINLDKKIFDNVIMQ